MRIALLTNSFPPDGRGGAERLAFLQADTLACLGHEVRIWAPKTGEGPIERVVTHGMEVMRFPSPFGELDEMSPLGRFNFHVHADIGARMEVVDDIRAWKPDVLLTHNLIGCGMRTASVVQQGGVRWVHTLHDIQLTDPSGQETVRMSQSFILRAWRSFWFMCRRRVFGTPDTVISPTQWLLDWYANEGWFSQGVVIPNPDPTPVRTHAGARPLRLPATLGFVGRLSKDKGFDVLLDLLPRLDASLVGRVVVVGEGPLMERARKMKDGRLQLLGALPSDKAHAVIADADILLASSRILENQQTIIIEAMAEGTPVVASDTGGTRETLEGTGCPVVSTGKGMSDGFEKEVRRLLSDAGAWTDASRRMTERAGVHDPEHYFSVLFDVLSGSK